jgi:hypothetical protein
METLGEQMSDAEGRYTAAAGGVAHLNKASAGFLRDAEGEAGGTAHEHVG